MAKGSVHLCLRCGYKWEQRLSRFPKRCANVECRSPYWQTEATQGVKRDTRVSSRKNKAAKAKIPAHAV